MNEIRGAKRDGLAAAKCQSNGWNGTDGRCGLIPQRLGGHEVRVAAELDDVFRARLTSQLGFDGLVVQRTQRLRAGLGRGVGEYQEISKAGEGGRSQEKGC